MKKYKVWTTTKKYFDTLAAAMEYANNYFACTGEIVAITEYKARKR